jgi:hydrogenase/urease accessory protein HupE
MPRPGRIAFLALAASVSVLAATAAAHPAPFSYIDVRLDDGPIDVTVVAHVYDLGHELGLGSSEALLDRATLAAHAPAIAALLAPRFQLVAGGRALACRPAADSEPLPDRHSVQTRFTCDATNAGLLAVRALMFPYDATHQTFLNIYEGSTLRKQAILDAGHDSMEYFRGTHQGVIAVIDRFVPAGVHHILIGPDHLLFLVGLLLLGGTVRRLLLVVSAFTLAHSVTLSVAALNLVTPPARLIEPAIALSIVYVGCDNLLVRGGRDVRPWIALGFGLIHGFGFAGVLREMDLPSRALGWSLFSFNVGVEIGQLLVVVAVASALAALRRRSEWAGRTVALAGSVAVILAGAFWFIERVFFTGGMT